MNKILSVIITFFLISGINYSKTEKIYVNSENSFVTVLNYSTWFANDTTDYIGKFTFVNPAEDDLGNPNGDGYMDNLQISYINGIENSLGFSVFAYSALDVEGWDSPMMDTLKNARIECEGEMLISSKCSLVSDSFTGEYVILKYKTKIGTVKETKGIIIARSDNPGYKYFYEKNLEKKRF